MSNLEKLRKLHKPVLVTEVLKAFDLDKGSLALSKKRVKIIDATLGIGGHAEELVKRGVEVLGIDSDKEMLDFADQRLKLACPTPEKKFQGSYKLVKGNFKDILSIAKENDFLNASGILYDLGVSSPQITSKTRGFSFQNDLAPLDMRISADNQSVKASDLLNVLRYDQLVGMFSKVLSRNSSKKLTDEILRYRETGTFKNVGDFKTVISKVLTRKGRRSTETLPFLALRMATNSELENLKDGLVGGVETLSPGGILAVISFHSGEDLVVSKMFNNFEKAGFGKQINKKPIVPSQQEIMTNIRSRSALLRIFKKSE